MQPMEQITQTFVIISLQTAFPHFEHRSVVFRSTFVGQILQRWHFFGRVDSRSTAVIWGTVTCVSLQRCSDLEKFGQIVRAGRQKQAKCHRQTQDRTQCSDVWSFVNSSLLDALLCAAKEPIEENKPIKKSDRTPIEINWNIFFIGLTGPMKP